MKADAFWRGSHEFGETICKLFTADSWVSVEAKNRFWAEIHRYHLHLWENASQGMARHPDFCLELAEFLVICLKPKLKAAEHPKLLTLSGMVLCQAHLLPAEQNTANDAALNKCLTSREAAAEWTACFFKRHWRCGAEAVAA